MLILLFSCKGKQELPFITVEGQYAEGISITKMEGYTSVQIRYPGENKIQQTLIVVPKSQALPEELPEGILIRTPLTNVVSFSAVTCGMIDEIGEINTITGLTEPQYIRIPELTEGVQQARIADLGLASKPNIEKIILLEPEAIFFNPMPGEDMGILKKQAFPVIQCLDYKENTPLGQTEWIRLIGLLFEKEDLADSLFRETSQRYNKLKQLSQAVDFRPCVFTELKYGDFWYMPGGNSYIANLLLDAGADYLWKDDPHTGTIHFSFEQVLDQAESCDFWLIKRYEQEDLSYESLAAEYSNYTLFSAYRQRNIYVCNTARVPYYEELPLHPDRVLQDMIYLFHPELLPGYTPRYYFPMNGE